MIISSLFDPELSDDDDDDFPQEFKIEFEKLFQAPKHTIHSHTQNGSNDVSCVFYFELFEIFVVTYRTIVRVWDCKKQEILKEIECGSSVSNLIKWNTNTFLIGLNDVMKGYEISDEPPFVKENSFFSVTVGQRFKNIRHGESILKLMKIDDERILIVTLLSYRKRVLLLNFSQTDQFGPCFMVVGGRTSFTTPILSKKMKNNFFMTLSKNEVCLFSIQHREIIRKFSLKMIHHEELDYNDHYPSSLSTFLNSRREETLVVGSGFYIHLFNAFTKNEYHKLIKRVFIGAKIRSTFSFQDKYIVVGGDRGIVFLVKLGKKYEVIMKKHTSIKFNIEDIQYISKTWNSLKLMSCYDSGDVFVYTLYDLYLETPLDEQQERDLYERIYYICHEESDGDEDDGDVFSVKLGFISMRIPNKYFLLM